MPTTGSLLTMRPVGLTDYEQRELALPQHGRFGLDRLWARRLLRGILTWLLQAATTHSRLLGP